MYCCGSSCSYYKSNLVVFFVLWLAVRVLWAGQRHPLQRDAQHLQDDLAGSAGILVLRV